ncbi:Thromboxane-A synthase [Dinochytrium kinnereticum]|nr:Thromboxane-A synthase [Dinochytrium kinnereticum]
MDFITAHPAVAVVLTVGAAALVLDTLLPKKNGTVPEVSTRWPFIGHTLDFLQASSKQKTHERLARGRKLVGNIQRTELLGGLNFVFTSDPETVKRLFVSDEFLRSDFVMPLAVGMFQYGLFMMPTDDIWKKHRKFIQPGFGPSHIRRTLEVSNNVLDKLFDIWNMRLEEQGEGYVTDMFHIASSITLDVIGHIAFSFDYKAVENHENEASMAAMKAYQRAFEVINIRVSIPPPLWGFFGVSIAQVQKEIKPLRDTIMQTICSKRVQLQERKEVAKAAGESEDTEGIKGLKALRDLDVLDRLVDTDNWTEEEMTDEVIALFLAGGETTANTIAFAVLLLDQFPDSRDKMLQEIDDVVGDVEHVTAEILNSLKYTEYVIKETLRLYPSVSVPVGRVPQKDVQILGHNISKGSIVFSDLMGLHRDPRHWKHPEAFNPSRWINFTPAPGTYLPFSDGPHACIGMRMAMIELKCVLARIYRNYIPSVVIGQDIDPVSSVTLGLKNGLKINLTRRT